MTPQELLGVIVRAAGLGMLLIAVFDTYYVLAKTVGIPTQSAVPVMRDVQGVIIWSVLGLAVVACAKWIVRLAYFNSDK